MSKILSYILIVAAVTFVSITTTTSSYADPPGVSVHSGNSTDGIDFDNVPLPLKYAHGSRVLTTFHAVTPSPPAEPEARERYLKAQMLTQHGFAYLMNGRPKDAIAPLEQSRDLWPDSAATYRWLAEAYTGAGQTDKAIENYRLLFYGWPGKTTPSSDWEALGKGTVRPSTEPSDYKQPNPEETDPILLFQFSLLLQQTNQEDEAKAVYDRAMAVLLASYTRGSPHPSGPLPPYSSSALTPTALQAATFTQLAIREQAINDWTDAEDNLSAALLMKPKDPIASYYMAKVVQDRENAQTTRHIHSE